MTENVKPRRQVNNGHSITPKRKKKMNEELKETKIRSDKLSKSQTKISNPVISWEKGQQSQRDVGSDKLTVGHEVLKCQARGVSNTHEQRTN